MLFRSASFANAAAAISVTRPGAQTSAPVRKEIEQLLATGKIPRLSPNLSSAANGDGNGWTNFPQRPVRKTLKILAEV